VVRRDSSNPNENLGGGGARLVKGEILKRVKEGPGGRIVIPSFTKGKTVNWTLLLPILGKNQQEVYSQGGLQRSSKIRAKGEITCGGLVRVQPRKKNLPGVNHRRMGTESKVGREQEQGTRPGEGRDFKNGYIGG